MRRRRKRRTSGTRQPPAAGLASGAGQAFVGASKASDLAQKEAKSLGLRVRASILLLMLLSLGSCNSIAQANSEAGQRPANNEKPFGE